MKQMKILLQHSKIIHLNLGSNSFKYTCLKQLFEGLVESSVEILNLSSCNFHSSSLEPMKEHLAQTNVNNLNLKSNQFTNESFHNLWEGLVGSSVEILNLSYFNFNSSSLEPIKENLAQTNVKNLNLSDNKFTNESFYNLWKGLVGSSVEIINFKYCQIGTYSSLEAMKCTLHKTKIKNLDFEKVTFMRDWECSTIGESDFNYLCEGLRKSCVETLNLSNKKITNLEPMKIILPLTKINYLILDKNEFGNVGFKDLCQGLIESHVKKLSVLSL